MCTATVRSHSIPSTAHNSPSRSLFGSTHCLMLPTNISNCKSAPVSPKTENKSITCPGNTHSMSDIYNKDTNADPLSVAAMSLPHFRTKTAFGFTTLKESPHTRRKESLFHIEGDTLLAAQSTKRRSDLLEPLDFLPDVTNVSEIDTSLYKDTPMLTPSVVITPHYPDGEEPHINGVDYNSMDTLDVSAMIRRQSGYYRRRSSLGLRHMNGQDSQEESTAANMSPEAKRRATSTLSPYAVVLPQKRHSSPEIETERKTENNNMQLGVVNKPRSCSCNNIAKVNINPQAKYGELKFAFQYLAKSKQLKVLLIRAENIGGPNRLEQNTNTFAKLCLMPGKIQKHTSDIIKHTRNPEFNRELYFQDLQLEQLHAMTLRIKLFHKSHNLRLPELIGEVNVALDSYDLLAENRMWKDIESKRDSEVSISNILEIQT